MAVKPRLTPTLFDKLVADTQISGLSKSAADTVDVEKMEITQDAFRFYSVPKLERFNEAALRMTIKREVAWLLNTVAFDVNGVLDAYPQVKTSVINYGVPDLAGKVNTRRGVVARAREIRKAIHTFEPRIAPDSLVVEPGDNRERSNTVTYQIRGDITAAANAMPIKLRTDIDADLATVTVTE